MRMRPALLRDGGCFGGAGLLLTILAGPACAGAAAPNQPAAPCARSGTDDTLRPLPQSLLGLARAALAVSAPDDVMKAGTVFRCTNGTTMVCFVGANLQCGDRVGAGPSADPVRHWCRAHPGARSVPAVVSGHDMLGSWHCAGTRAIRSPSGERVDARGFVARIWKPLR